MTIEDLFGDYCSGGVFRYDIEVASTVQQAATLVVEDSQATTDSGLDYHSHASAADDENTPASADTLCPCEPPLFAYGGDKLHDSQDSQGSTTSEFSKERRGQAHDAMLQNAVGGCEWMPIGLVSTSDGHSLPDMDLGYG